jgi:hypothetical protein
MTDPQPAPEPGPFPIFDDETAPKGIQSARQLGYTAAAGPNRQAWAHLQHGHISDRIDSDLQLFPDESAAIAPLEAATMFASQPWDELTFEQQRSRVAAGYADVIERSIATLRKSLQNEPGVSPLPTLRWFAKNLQEQGDAMERRLLELGGHLPHELPEQS